MLLYTQMTKLEKTASRADKEQSSGSFHTLLKGVYVSAGKLESPIRVEVMHATCLGGSTAHVYSQQKHVHMYTKDTYKNILGSVIPNSQQPEIAQMLTNNRMEKLIVLYSYNVKLCSNENE